MKRQGRKSKAQTPAPKSEQIKGSSENPTGTAASKKSAESIKLSPAIISVLEKKKDEYNKKHKSKVTLSTLKAVFRRGSGAYSSSHRPTITGGMPNSRSAWAYARVNAFLRKKGGGYAKKSYVQDDDLMEEGGVIKSNDMKLLAPNGKPSNLTHEQYKLVRTPAFKAWFGDWENDPKNASKIVDDNREPMVVYHGTNKLFNIFSDEKKGTNTEDENTMFGFFFSKYIDEAKFYMKEAIWKDTPEKYDELFGGRIISAFLVVKNPLKVGYGESLNVKKIKTLLDSINDGIWDDRGDFIVFKSNQIKLADGSNVTFVPNNPDIRYAKGGNIEEEAQMYIDVISMNPTLEKYQKYKDILKNKFDIDYDLEYGNHDEKLINNANLSDIKRKDDFLNYDNYVKYANKIFKLRGFIQNQPNHIEGIVNIDLASKIGNELGFMVELKTYSGHGNYAEALGDVIRMPNEVDVNTFIHEIGHFFDHQYSKEYIGDAKNSTYATSLYYLGKSNEVFAENFMTYFISPDWLKNNMPNVYYELDKKIPEKYKKTINDLINQVGVSANPDIRYEKGGQLDDLINQGIVELKMFNTTPEHAKEYGFNSKNPLYLQSIYISQDYRLKGIGSQVFEHIIDYAEKNEHDLIFGHITQKAEPNIDVIKKILNDNGFNTIDGNNDFYKIIDRKYSVGGKLKNELVEKELDGVIKQISRRKYIVKGRYKNTKKHQLELIDLLKSLGFEIFGIDKGATTNSRYFDFEKGNLIGHIRISDHTTADERAFKFLEMESRRYYVLSVRNNESSPNIYIDIEILSNEDFNYIKEWFMNKTDTYAKGGEVKHNQGAAGGYLVGNRHSQGGIKAVNKSTGQPLEMEGGEVVITRNAVNDNTKREFNGKMMTNKEILSAINVSGGGVSFADGGKVSECTCSGRRYKFGGRLMKDYEVIEEIRNQYPADFKKGVGEELSEHKETFKLLVKRKLTPKQAAERVVAEHLQKKPDYYDNYLEGGTIDIMGRKIVDYQSFQKGGIPVKSPYVGESDEYFKVYHPTKKTHVYAKGGNIRRAVISPLLAYKNFLHMVYDINFSELPNTLKNGLLQGKQNLVDKYIA